MSLIFQKVHPTSDLRQSESKILYYKNKTKKCSWQGKLNYQEIEKLHFGFVGFISFSILLRCRKDNYLAIKLGHNKFMTDATNFGERIVVFNCKDILQNSRIKHIAYIFNARFNKGWKSFAIVNFRYVLNLNIPPFRRE